MISRRKEATAASFERAACIYDSAAVVQRAVGHRLAEWIGRLDLPARPVVLEIGCGTGLFTRAAMSYLNPSLWLATDISPAMVTCCQHHFSSDPRFLFSCMDGEAPAFAASFDLVCANLAAQWFDDLAGSLERLAHLIQGDGWLAFTTLMAGTFGEWVETHQQLGLVAGTPIYPDMVTLAHQLPHGGDGTITGETFRHIYPNAHAFVSALKNIGAHVAAPDRRPLTPGTFRRVLRTFGVGGAVTVSYHVAYGLWRRHKVSKV